MVEKTLNKALELELARGDERSIITIVDKLILHAHEVRASDIHIDPSDKETKVRLRVDGVLHLGCTLPKDAHEEVVSRIKVLTGLRTDEHNTAQDGRFRIYLASGVPIDVRVSIAPTYHGENAVLRLLIDKEENFSLEALGFSKIDAEKVREAAKKTSGMILSTGPTGSGKTTTLYTLLKLLNTDDVSIITIEDPIEYAVGGIEQIQVNAKTGLTFANGLRSILRQDPNIIMVGEIRDKETAGIAINTALTGHLLLSTLHTSDASTTLPRLLDMGIEPYLVASTVNIAIGQRLVRSICKKCKTERKMSETEKKHILSILPEGVKGTVSLSEGKGCAECNHTGFRGRICVNEILTIDNNVRDAILRRASASEIRGLAVKGGMTTLIADGMKKVLDGKTTIEEVLRVIHE